MARGVQHFNLMRKIGRFIEWTHSFRSPSPVHNYQLPLTWPTRSPVSDSFPPVRLPACQSPAIIRPPAWPHGQNQALRCCATLTAVVVAARLSRRLRGKCRPCLTKGMGHNLRRAARERCVEMTPISPSAGCPRRTTGAGSGKLGKPKPLSPAAWCACHLHRPGASCRSISSRWRPDDTSRSSASRR